MPKQRGSKGCSKCLSYEIKIKELTDRIQYLTDELRKDPLTGLLNRRGIEEQAHYLLSIFAEENNGKHKRRSDRYHLGHLTVIFVDLNNFKKINDTYGHWVGDELLRKFSRFLSIRTRAIDLVGRWGGDEFIILLPKARQEDGVKLIRKLQKDLMNSPFGVTKRKFRLGVACGVVSTSTVRYPTFERLVKNADHQMYRDKTAKKRRGR